MNNDSDASFDDVKLPQHRSDAKKRWRVVLYMVLSVRAFSLVRVDVTRKRWRKICIKLRFLVAFYRAKDSIAAEQFDNLLPSLPDTVVEVIPELELADLKNELAHLKNIGQLQLLGGVPRVAFLLETDVEKGIQGDHEDVIRRRLDFGPNTIQKPTPKTLHILFEPFRDPIIIILLICATLSLCFGIKHHGLRGWSDGGSIYIAVFAVNTVTTLSNIWPRIQFSRLSKAIDDFSITVIRNGQRKCISVFEAVVGDIICLKTGDQVPADGLYIDGNSLQVDESIPEGTESVEINESNNPFFLSGTKVINGSARMLVTAVGINTEWGKMLSSKGYNTEERIPLQRKLHELTIHIAKLSLMVASLVLIVLLIRYFLGNMRNENDKSDFTAGKTRIYEVCNALIGILATPVVIAATAIPEGLLLAVMITIAYSTKRMASQKALVRNLAACEVVGSTTVICTDERGNLTLSHPIVSEFCFGNQLLEEGTSPSTPRNVLELLFEGILLRNTEVPSGSTIEFTENQVHSTIQKWGVQDMGVNVEQVRGNCTIHSPEIFNEEKTQSVIWIKKNTIINIIQVHQKGEPEVILSMCSQYYDADGLVKDMSMDAKEDLTQIFQEMKSKGLRCIAFAHKEVPEEHGDEGGNFNPKLKEENSTFIGCLGLKYPCRSEVQKAVTDCQQAGVNIKLVTRNDLHTARAIAIECGIIEPNQDTMTGELVDSQRLQNNAEEEIIENCDRIRVMARASTLDKLYMMRGLKQRGHVVAFTGHSIGDATVLREASVGLSLGIQGTHQAKENSDIIILDDNFDTLARVLRWGRGGYHKIQIYAQFQLTVGIASLVTDFATAVSATEPPTINIVASISAGKVPYATFQVLWVKLIVGTLAVLAITIEEPAEELKQLPLVDLKQPFITCIMWKNIAGQALYPIIVLLTIQFKGQSTFNLDAKIKDTMIFNIFVLWQLFIIFTTKRVKENIFKRMRRRKIFWGVIGITILLQVLIVELLKKLADTEQLTWKQWIICIGIAFLAWPIGWLVERIKCPSETAFIFMSC